MTDSNSHAWMDPALGHWFSLREAASACAVSHSTVVRRHRSGAFPHAVKDDTDTWRVPLADLLASGLTPGQTQVNDLEQPSVMTAAPASGQPEGLVHLSVSEYAALIERAARGDALAQMVSTQQRTIDDLADAIGRLAITAAPAPSEPAQPDTQEQQIDLREPAPEPVNAGRRSRWWHRRATAR